MNHDKINLLRKKIQNITEMLELAVKKKIQKLFFSVLHICLKQMLKYKERYTIHKHTDSIQ